MKREDFDPGPWFSEPRWRKVWLWTRYVLPSRACSPLSMVRYAWTYHVTLRRFAPDAYGDKFPSDGTIAVSPRMAWELFSRIEDHRTGRYYIHRPGVPE